uniref:hypothetical protein n=1 Tax=Pseudofabraea citricarpa TaxID=1664388 RepID=UPI0022FD95BF
KYIGFLTLLYAGTTSILSFNYSIYNYIVKKLKQWSLSAGNISFYTSNGTPETLRDKTVNIENVKNISVHVPTHHKPAKSDEFSHYLAGLIDGNGEFNSKQELVIKFNSSDASLAYYIKKRLGYGSVKKVKKVKGETAFLLVVSNIKAIEKVIDLINGKIRTSKIFTEINENILNKGSGSGSGSKSYLYGNNLNFFKLNPDKDLKNYWLAGFSDAKASFHIKAFIDRSKIELNFQINEIEDENILYIKNSLGGKIEYKDTCQYKTSSLGSTKKVIKYFDKFHLLSSKHVNYLKWRKAYLIIQENEHLSDEGLKKIIKRKNTINRLSVDTV